jgi:hypothetical protein
MKCTHCEEVLFKVKCYYGYLEEGIGHYGNYTVYMNRQKLARHIFNPDPHLVSYTVYYEGGETQMEVLPNGVWYQVC